MHLIPFTEEDFPLLVGWIPDKEFNLLWGGPLYSWPITVDQVSAHQTREEVSSFMLTDIKEKDGFIELFRESESHYWVCRVLIAAESARAKGYGKQLVGLAMEHAQNNLGAKKLSLGVFEKNKRAIQCYRSLGFQISAREEKSRQFQGQWWQLLRMERAL